MQNIKTSIIILLFPTMIFTGCKKLPNTDNLTGKDLHERFLAQITGIDYIENRKLYSLSHNQANRLINMLSNVVKLEFIGDIEQSERPKMFNFHKRVYAYPLLIDDKGLLYFNRNVLFPVHDSELRDPSLRNFWRTRHWIKMDVDGAELSSLIEEIRPLKARPDI